MSKIAVIYWSGTGNTEQMAQAVAEGAQAAGAQVETFTVDAITVSPVAVKVDYAVDSEVVWSNAPSGRQDPEDSRQMERYFENVEILLTKTDGTVIDMTNSGGSIRPEHGITVCDKGEVFDEIIPLEELASISVGGVVYPISAD